MTATASIHNAPDPFSSDRISTIFWDLGGVRYAIEISGRSPSSSLFIGDKPENCAAARVLGMQAIPFESPAQLTRELGALGIQTA